LVIGENSAHLRRRDENVFRLLLLIKALDGDLVEEIQFRMGSSDEMSVASPGQFPPDGAPREAPVPGDIDPRILLHCCD
jgi:hypothetical protein